MSVDQQMRSDEVKKSIIEVLKTFDHLKRAELTIEGAMLYENRLDAIEHLLNLNKTFSNNHPTQDILDTLENIKRLRTTIHIRTTLDEYGTRTALQRSTSSSSSLAPPASLRPPNGAVFLLDLLLATSDRAVIPGDLEEDFATSILPKYGPVRARMWFWGETVRTIATRNPICRSVLVGGLMRLGEWIFRQIGG
jgi:hypothetical protein